eukprot:7037974-Prymnesium_polylepis.1
MALRKCTWVMLLAEVLVLHTWCWLRIAHSVQSIYRSSAACYVTALRYGYLSRARRPNGYGTAVYSMAAVTFSAQDSLSAQTSELSVHVCTAEQPGLTAVRAGTLF